MPDTFVNPVNYKNRTTEAAVSEWLLFLECLSTATLVAVIRKR